MANYVLRTKSETFQLQLTLLVHQNNLTLLRLDTYQISPNSLYSHFSFFPTKTYYSCLNQKLLLKKSKIKYARILLRPKLFRDLLNSKLSMEFLYEYHPLFLVAPKVINYFKNIYCIVIAPSMNFAFFIY
jgi:hypothetical protein